MDAYNYLIEELNKMMEFFASRSFYRFVSASLFILIDNINKKYTCKIIGNFISIILDFTHYEKLQPGQIDENFLTGLINLNKYLMMSISD